MFILISYVCVFVQYHQMAIPTLVRPSPAPPTGSVPLVAAVPPRHVLGEGREDVEDAPGDEHVIVDGDDE